MVFMSRETGKDLASELEHVVQCLINIITTPIGSRVGDRDFGSGLFNLLDLNMNRTTLALMRAATATAIDKWEPRVRIDKVTFDTSGYAVGELLLDLEYFYLPGGVPQRLQGLKIKFGV